MKLVFIIGNAAVGKMTVGQELMKITDLRLFHNHMTIEPVIEIFGYYDGNVVQRLREVVFEEFAASENAGLIFTFMWAFDMQSDRDYMLHVAQLFEEKGADIYCVELVAPQEIRLERNVTENRLKNKASKRDLDFSRKILLDADQKHRIKSVEGEIPFANYLRIDNSQMEPADVAAKIKEKFAL